MSISVQCPGCGKSLTAPDELAGKRGKCPKCSRQFLIASLAHGENPKQSSEARSASADLASLFPLTEALKQRFKETVGKVRFLSLSTEEKLMNLIGCIAHNATDERLEQAVKEYDTISADEFDTMWPLFEDAIPKGKDISFAAARIGPLIKPLRWERGYSGSRIIDMAVFYRSFAQYVCISNQVPNGKKIAPEIINLAQRMDRTSDAEQLGMLGMSLAWLGEGSASEQCFIRALELSNADTRVLQHVRAGEVVAENHPGAVSAQHVLEYHRRAKVPPKARVEN